MGLPKEKRCGFTEKIKIKIKKQKTGKEEGNMIRLNSCLVCYSKTTSFHMSEK